MDPIRGPNRALNRINNNNNILVRSWNWQIGKGHLQRSAFRHVEGIHQKLTHKRLEKAQKEMFKTGKTMDRDVITLMKELSLYSI